MIFDEMVEQYIKLNMFQIVKDRKIYYHPDKIFDFPLTLETVNLFIY